MEAQTTKKPIMFFFEDTDISPLEIIKRDYEWRMNDVWMNCEINGSDEFEMTGRQEIIKAKHKDLIRGLERGYYVIENRTLYELSYEE